MNKFIAEIKSLLILILIILFLKETVVEAYIVPTTSMEENILKGDFLIGSRYIYGMKVPEKIWIPFSAISIPTFLPEYRFPAFKQVARGDVVVFEYPRDPVYKYVKRCIGIAGDTVKIEDQNVYVNGELVPLPEGGKFIINNYLSKEVIDPDIFLGKQGNKDQYPEITIPKKGDSFTLDENMDWKLVLPLLLYEGNKIQYILVETGHYNMNILSSDWLGTDLLGEFNKGDFKPFSLVERFDHGVNALLLLQIPNI